MESVKRLPLVSILIVNWNGGSVLRDCLKSLFKIDYPSWELILIDNGSNDGSQKLPFKFKLIQNKKNLGFAEANNQGAKIARGKYILLLNNDTKVNKDFLSLMVERMEQDPQIAAMQPKIYLMDEKGYLDNAGTFLTTTGFLKHWGFMQKDSKQYDSERLIFSAKGACLLTRKDVIQKIGLFDNDFGSYFEESDFCWRLWLAGFKVLYYPKTFIFHKLGFTTRRQDVPFINYLSFRNRICSLIKNLDGFNLITILSLHLLLLLGISAVFLIKGQLKHSYIIIKSIWWNIGHLRSTLVKRSQIQKMRQISDKDLFNTVLQPFNWSKAFGDFGRIEEDLKRKIS